MIHGIVKSSMETTSLSDGYKALKRSVNISLNDFIAATSKQLEDEGEKWATQ